MMPLVDPVQASAWAEALLRASVQGGAVIIIVAAVLRLLRSLPPSVHAWAWRLTMLKMLAGLALTAPILLEGPAALPGDADAVPASTGLTSATLAGLIVIISMFGGAIVLVGLGADFVAARRLRRHARLCDRPAIVAEIERLAHQLKLRRLPQTRESAAIDRPLLLGGGRPVVVLPAAMLDGEQRSTISPALSAILGHELAHLKRHDLAWGWLAAVASAVFFFHPLVWWAQNRLRRAQDEACDALALRFGRASPAEYGSALLRLAQRLPGRAFAAPLAAGVVEPFHHLRHRLQKLGQPTTRWRIAPVVAFALVCVAAAPTWRVERRPDEFDLAGALFVQTPDDQPITVPVILGDGPGAIMIPFTSEKQTPATLALPVEPLSNSEQPASPAQGARAKIDQGGAGRRGATPARSLGSIGREETRSGEMSSGATSVSPTGPHAAGPSRSKEMQP